MTAGVVLLLMLAACSPEPAPAVWVALSYVADTPAGERLYREQRDVAAGPDPATAAVTAVLAAPTGTDPDYRNPWPAGTALRGLVTHADTVVTVDLTGVDRVPAGLAAVALARTAQDALGTTDPVRLLLDGRQVGPPVPRGEEFAVRSLVQIDAPAHGAVVGRDVEVTGEAAVFEATVHRSVLRDGTVVRSGVTSTAEGQQFSPFRFTVSLEPGTYVVRVTEDDPSDGEGRAPSTDDKTIIVR